MVDEIRVPRLLRGLADHLGVLRGEAGADDSRRADPMWLGGVKYTFITSIETCVDIAQHICSAQGWGPPADDGDAMNVLGVHGALSAELADAMRKSVGFRNVLVVSRLSDLGDLERFSQQIAAFVQRG